MRSHEIEYKLYGDDMQFVAIELAPKKASLQKLVQ
ncbi:Uncharacterized protein BCB44BAC_03920 [Bacillus cytotoxicus]|uniref:Uncharacterized protein n=1 Tax=Bacillus cytotoxicus TaxID=580165 RepID=A0AAX2CM54_9BACI|nr:Uncharacterized protein BCB44BAC_03920 [Bacillus cytotoxicus]